MSESKKLPTINPLDQNLKTPTQHGKHESVHKLTESGLTSPKLSGIIRLANYRSSYSSVAGKGSVVVYHAPFEKSVLGYLAECFPEHREALRSIVDRLWDQLQIFKRHYTDYRCRGSNSLKNVLPVLVPTMSYDEMGVSEGGEAQTTWNEMICMSEGKEREELVNDLKDYCGMDTGAMVEIMKTLNQI